MKTLITTLSLILVSWLSSVQATENQQTPETLVQHLLDDIIAVSNNLSLEANAIQLKEVISPLLTTYFDMETIKNFILGKYRRRIPPADIEAFSDILPFYISNTLGQYMKYLQKGTFTLDGKEPIKNRYAVYTTFHHEDVSYAFTFLVESKNNQWRIIDLAFESLSLSITSRKAFEDKFLEMNANLAHVVNSMKEDLQLP